MVWWAKREFPNEGNAVRSSKVEKKIKKLTCKKEC